MHPYISDTRRVIYALFFLLYPHGAPRHTPPTPGVPPAAEEACGALTDIPGRALRGLPSRREKNNPKTRAHYYPTFGASGPPPGPLIHPGGLPGQCGCSWVLMSVSVGCGEDKEGTKEEKVDDNGDFQLRRS